MDTTASLHRLDQVPEITEWPFDRERGRHSWKQDGYTLHIEARHEHYLWMLEHERFGVLMAWAPANTRAKAREEALAYWRAHLQSHMQHQHAE